MWHLVSFFPFTTNIPGDSFPFQITSLSQKQSIAETTNSGPARLLSIFCVFSVFSPIPFWDDPGWCYLYFSPVGPCCTLFYSCNTPGSVLVWSLEVLLSDVWFSTWVGIEIYNIFCMFLVSSGHGNCFLFYLVWFSLLSLLICIHFKWRVVWFVFRWCDG